jgi:hypothetical protein
MLTRRALLAAIPCCLSSVSAQPAPADPALLTEVKRKDFLRKAKVIKTKTASRGVTGTLHATLSDGRLTHDASIQSIDEFKPVFQTALGSEFNFKDSWKFDLAAYKLDRLLGLNMTPISVTRKYAGKSSCFTWWVDDVLMIELERYSKKIDPPDVEAWNQQLSIVRVFDQLIYNTDRNLGNLVIDKKWQVWMIDHTRAFRINNDLREPRNLTKCDRALLQKMRSLNQELLKRELGKHLTDGEIKSLLARRDKIVKFFEEKGEAALYDSPRRPLT